MEKNSKKITGDRFETRIKTMINIGLLFLWKKTQSQTWKDQSKKGRKKERDRKRNKVFEKPHCSQNVKCKVKYWSTLARRFWDGKPRYYQVQLGWVWHESKNQ